MNLRSIIDRLRYMTLHQIWRAEITGNEEIQIDESIFEEIYKMQEEQDGENN